MNENQTVDVLSADGKKSGTAELPGALFDVQTNIPLIHQVVVAQQAAARQGTHATKTRGRVSGGGKKPWRQKGTGRARQGSTRAPQWAGGGIVHGPQPRSYAQRTPKKMIAAALRGALSDRAREGQVLVLSGLVDGDKPSTKQARTTLAGLGDPAKTLVVLDRDDTTSWLSVRNLTNVHVLLADQLNAYDVVNHDRIVFTQSSLDAFIASRAGSTVAAEEIVEAKPAKKAKAPKKAEEPKLAPLVSTPDAAEDKPAYAGSHRGEAKDGFDIKGNEDSMKFHTPQSPFYDATVAEVWFDSVESAKAAGFSPVKGDAGAEQEDEK